MSKCGRLLAARSSPNILNVYKSGTSLENLKFDYEGNAAIAVNRKGFPLYADVLQVQKGIEGSIVRGPGGEPIGANSYETYLGYQFGKDQRWGFIRPATDKQYIVINDLIILKGRSWSASVNYARSLIRDILGDSVPFGSLKIGQSVAGYYAFGRVEDFRGAIIRKNKKSIVINSVDGFEEKIEFSRLLYVRNLLRL